MELVVRALRCPPPDQPHAIQARFGTGGGRIGRSNTCVLPLPSPDRYISREHLEVRFRDGAFSLKVISKVNGVNVNDAAVPPGAAVQLSDGDKIQLGDYLLVAELQAGPAARAARGGDSLAVFGFGATAPGGLDSLDLMARLAPPPAPSDPQFDTSPGWARPGMRREAAPAPRPVVAPLEADPLASPLGRLLDATPQTAPAAEARGRRRAAAPSQPDTTGAGALEAFLGGGLDPTATPAAQSLSEQAQGLFRQQDTSLAMPGANHGATALPFEDDIFSVLDGEFSPRAGIAARPATNGQPDLGRAAVPFPGAPAPGDAMDGFDEIDIALGTHPGTRPAAREAVVAPNPVAAPESTPTLAPAGKVAADAAGVNPGELMAALAGALGLEPGELDASRPVETVRVVGELLAMTVGGLHQMLEMRAQLKNELRIEDRTMIAARENNPLKHADSARDALRYLVDVRQHGNKLFMQPGKAIGDAVSDVCAHEMAVMAGTRAALLAALKMFSPDVVEKRIKKSGALDSVVPALHRAKLWDSFLAMYGELEKEAEDHFDRLLNQEFARAYAEQGKKLRRRK